MTKETIKELVEWGDHSKAVRVLEKQGLTYSRQALHAWVIGKTKKSPAEKAFIKAYEQVIGKRNKQTLTS